MIAEPAAPRDKASINHEKPFCQGCQSNENVKTIEVPYGCKLFLNEIVALHLAPRLVLEERPNE